MLQKEMHLTSGGEGKQQTEYEYFNVVKTVKKNTVLFKKEIDYMLKYKQ